VLDVRSPSTVARGLAAFAAGLGAGLFLPGPWTAVPVIVGLWLAALGPTRAVGFVVLTGLAHGALARVSDASSCGRRMTAGIVRLTVRLHHPAVAGRPVPAEPVGLGCRGEVTVRHRAPDTLAAGTAWVVEGRWIPDQGRWRPAGGLLAIREARPGPEVRPGVGHRLRNWIVPTIGELYGSRAGLIEALVLGSRGTLEPALSAGFARSGLVHLLSISGFHIGLVWAWVVLGLGLAGRRRQAPLIATVAVGSYVGFIGFPAPAVRALALAILDAWLTWRQRRVAVGALSATVAWIVLLVDPWALTDLGGWLSVAAMWGAIAATRWADGAGWTSGVGTVIASSAGATMATAPFAALVLGSVSVVGILLNVVAIPLAAIAMPAALLSVVLAGFAPPVAAALAAGGGLLLDGLERLAVLGAWLPGAAISFEPGIRSTALAAAVTGSMAWVFGRRNRWREVGRRAAWVAVAGLFLGLVSGIRWGEPGGPALHFLDVGQGDALLVSTGRGRWILIDAGPVDARGDAGRRVVLPYLLRRGVRRLTLAVVSHAHRDHFGGLGSVIARVPPLLVAEPGLPVPDRDYLALLDAIDDRGIEWRPLRRGDRFVVDEVTLDVLHPDHRWPGFGTDVNENSVVIHLRIGRFDAILTGDAGFPVEARLTAAVGPVELLKVGHHGSRTATGADWLTTLRPKSAVVSVGSNGYGHPAPETIARLEGAKVPVWRTDRDGHVTVWPTGDSARIRSRRGDQVIPFHQ